MPQAVHASTDFETDVAVAGNGDVIAWVVPCFLWNARGVDSHVLVAGHGGAEVAIFDIDAHVASAMFGI